MSFGARLRFMRTDRPGPMHAPAEASGVPDRSPAPASALPTLASRLRAATPSVSPARLLAGVAAAPPGVVREGFSRSRIVLPLGSGAEFLRRPNLLGGAIDRVRLPDAQTLADSLAVVAAVPRAGLPHGCPAVLLDLETTGLSREAGCVPFMVGLAWHDGDALVVHQWILAQLSAEAAMLREVANVLRGPQLAAAAVVTFNGASFDLPLLRSRFVRHRIARPGAPTAVDGRPHFDLLVAARRLWKGRSPDCRLSTLERLQLSVQRHGDIHGSEIAEVYWRWIRDPNDPWAQAQLDTIEAHNRVDLLSLAGLAAELGQRLSRPQGWVEIVRAADHHARQRRPARALGVLQPALDAVLASADALSTEPDSLRCAALLGAGLLRKGGEHARAAALCACVCRSVPGDPEAHDHLAKHFEHRLRDPAAALSVAARSATPCARRLARLTRKAAAHSAAPMTYEAALARVCVVPAARPGVAV